jgi:vitamin K-dependent gamma-carboxylase
MQLYINNRIKGKTDGLVFINKFLFQPIDNSPLILFRFFFGFLIFLECSGSIITGWVKDVFVDPTFTFTFIDFNWLQRLSGIGMYLYFGLMAITGLMIMSGFFYRISIFSFFVLWTLTYLTQKSIYNNHYYLLSLLSFIMIFLPAERYFSFDVRYKRVPESFFCERWCVFVLLCQVSLVYIYAGIAKFYPDWWEGRPVEIWFSHKREYPFIGRYLQFEYIRKMIVYGGILFDILIVPLLIWKRTRVFGFLLGLFFHLFNSLVFLIGIFPYLMISLNILFFTPESIRNIFFKRKPINMAPSHTIGYGNRIILLCIIIYFSIQIFLPLRHFFYEGNVYWTEEGHRMAWHMMVRNKTGKIYFKIVEPHSKKSWLVFPEQKLTEHQYRTLAISPDMIWQYADFLKNYYYKNGFLNIEIYAINEVSLNGRPFQPMIDSKINLADVKWNPFEHSEWILPLKE